jgi:hypothetical protein
MVFPNLKPSPRYTKLWGKTFFNRVLGRSIGNHNGFQGSNVGFSFLNRDDDFDWSIEEHLLDQYPSTEKSYVKSGKN